MRQNPRLQVMQVATLFDQGMVIRESLATLLTSGRIGGIVALLVLLGTMALLQFFLLDKRVHYR